MKEVVESSDDVWDGLDIVEVAGEDMGLL